MPREALECEPLHAHLGSFPSEAWLSWPAPGSPWGSNKGQTPRSVPVVKCSPLALLSQGGGGDVRSRERRGKRLVRGACLGGRFKQPSQSALNSRQSVAGRIEGEFPAFRLLDIREVALAPGFRKRLVGRLPEQRTQRVTHDCFPFCCPAPVRPDWQTGPV